MCTLSRKDYAMHYHEAIAKAVTDYYNSHIEETILLSHQNNVGGKIRHRSGDLVESICKIVWERLANHHGIKSDIRKGETDRVKCTNANGNTIGMQVDKHCYVDNQLVLIQEAKSYLDRCYMIRASDDFQKIKDYNTTGNPASIIVAIENSIKQESYDFIMDEGHVDNVFYLADGKRRSMKPIWREEYRKPLNASAVLSYIAYVDNVLKEVLNDI